MKTALVVELDPYTAHGAHQIAEGIQRLMLLVDAAVVTLGRSEDVSEWEEAKEEIFAPTRNWLDEEDK